MVGIDEEPMIGYFESGFLEFPPLALVCFVRLGSGIRVWCLLMVDQREERGKRKRKQNFEFQDLGMIGIGYWINIFPLFGY